MGVRSTKSAVATGAFALLVAAGVGLLTASPASATILTVTFQGSVGSFIDTDNIYGFGAGADLTGKSVTDVYKIDTDHAVFTSGAPFGPGSADNTYSASFTGMNSVTSTIGGHALRIDATNGLFITEYSQHLYDPPNPYFQSLIELEVVGYEIPGVPASQFLIRDEAISYSLGIPLSLTATYGLTLADLNIGASAPGAASGVFYPYDGSSPGDFGFALGVTSSVPEPASWMILLTSLVVTMRYRGRGKIGVDV